MQWVVLSVLIVLAAPHAGAADAPRAHLRALSTDALDAPSVQQAALASRLKRSAACHGRSGRKPCATIRAPMTDSAAPNDSSALKQQIKQLIVERLKLEVEPAAIEDAQPLFGDGLGLDSIDALELVLGIEQAFGVKIEDEEMGEQALSSVNALADFVAAKRGAIGG